MITPMAMFNNICLVIILLLPLSHTPGACPVFRWVAGNRVYLRGQVLLLIMLYHIGLLTKLRERSAFILEMNALAAVRWLPAHSATATALHSSFSAAKYGLCFGLRTALIGFTFTL